MSNIKIESGIPIPNAPRKRGAISCALRAMKVGDSIFIEGLPSSKLSSRMWCVKAQTGFTFTSRTVTVDGVKGSRVWRTE